MKILISSFLMISSFLAIGQKTFEVPKLSSKGGIFIDGRMTGNEWDEASLMHLQVADGTDVENQKTAIRMTWDEDYIYVLYEVHDNHIVAKQTGDDSEVYYDDCVEAFFCPVHEYDSMYFGFEMNALGTVYDFIFFPSFHGNGNLVIKEYNPRGIKIKTSFANGGDKSFKGWLHEVAIPTSAFDMFSQVQPIKDGATWRFQLGRWDYQPNGYKVFNSLTQTGEFSPHVFEKMGFLKFTDKK